MLAGWIATIYVAAALVPGPDFAYEEPPAPAEAPEAAQEVEAPAWEGDWAEGSAWEAQTAYEEPSCAAGFAQPDGGLTRESGVNWHEGRRETYYSSNVLYHYRTPEWTLDEEGFWRDAEGRYVVAASDMEQGTVFEGSKGECIVLDCGCDAGTTDYYVAWE